MCNKVIHILLLFTQSCPSLCDPVDSSVPGFPILHYLPDLLRLMSIELMVTSNHLILSCPLLLMPSIFPSIRVFSSESPLHIRGLKYWSFNFSTGPFHECSELISFKIDWFDLLAVQGTVKESSLAPQFKSICIYILFRFFFILGYYRILNIVSYTVQQILVVYFIYSGIYLLIPCS